MSMDRNMAKKHRPLLINLGIISPLADTCSSYQIFQGSSVATFQDKRSGDIG